MKVTVPKGHHYSGRLGTPWFLRIPSMRRWVRLDESARYTLPPPHNKSINKVYGISFGLNEDESARWGSRWNEALQATDWVPYCHVGGKLNWDSQQEFHVVASLPFTEVPELDIQVTKTEYIFILIHKGQRLEHRVAHGKLPCYGITRGTYFGGQLPATHDYTVELSTSPL